MSRLNKAIKKSSKKAPIRIHRGSGNVFADLELPDPDERLAKAELAGRICMLIESERLSQAEAARRLGIDQPKVSMLMRGRLKDFSMERLMHFLVRLGQDVIIGIRDPRDRRHPSMRVLVEA